jgi:hypothetical protein
MKKLTTLLFAVTLLVGFSSVTMAQSTDYATINANAKVVGAMAVGTDNQDLEFNNILVNSSKYIDATDGSVDADAATTSGTVDGVTGSESRGYFSISIVGGTSVDLTLEVPSNLVDDQNELAIGFGRTGFNHDGGELNGIITETLPQATTSVTAITGGEGDDFSLSDGDFVNTFTMPAAGTVYLALGGEVNALANQELGTYTGTITLTATVSD